MRNLLLLSACVAFCAAQAQQINGYRYWFDDDVAGIVTTSVTEITELALTTNWPTTGLAPGFHRVSFQVRDTNGDWSVPHSTSFARSASAIVGYRYWVNDDVASLMTGTIGPNAVVDLNGVIAPGAFTRDFNTVTIQFQDADGEYGVPFSCGFVKGTGAVNGYQWWIDDEIASAVSGSIGPNNVVDLIADLPTTTTNGDHLFTIRFSGVSGTWSVPLTSEFSFFTSLEELPGLTDLLLFPNPTNEELSLRLTSADGDALCLSILDATGRTVRAEENWTPKGTSLRTWGLTDLAAGSYGLRIVNGEHQVTLRFLKN